MFSLNETCRGRAKLTVAGGQMKVHITLRGKKIVNLYPGYAKDAPDHVDAWLSPVEETVVYEDGYSDTVHAFDVPVSVIGKDFDLALIGTKGVWYDHKVSVSDPLTLDGTPVSLTDASAAEKSAGSHEKLSLSHAEQFSVYYEDGCAVVTIRGEGQILLVPHGKKAPEELAANRTVLTQGVNNAYLISTSGMDLAAKCGALDSIRFCSLKENDWFIPEPVDAMKDGKMLYAGKYSAPDFERLVAGGCNLVLANTMLRHKPQVIEKFEELGIPVIIEKANYEKDPLGRLEWIKFYGLLFGRLDEATAYFDSQVKRLGSLFANEKTGARVAFFALNSKGGVSIRRNSDYVVSMIKMAGGEYALEKIAGDSEGGMSSINVTMEDFSMAAHDADVLVYNGTIETRPRDMKDFVSKSPAFADFKAVRNGAVYTTDKDFFQKTTGIAEFILDMNMVVRAADGKVANRVADRVANPTIYLKKLSE